MSTETCSCFGNYENKSFNGRSYETISLCETIFGKISLDGINFETSHIRRNMQLFWKLWKHFFEWDKLWNITFAWDKLWNIIFVWNTLWNIIFVWNALWNIIFVWDWKHFGLLCFHQPRDCSWGTRLLIEIEIFLMTNQMWIFTNSTNDMMQGVGCVTSASCLLSFLLAVHQPATGPQMFLRRCVTRSTNVTRSVSQGSQMLRGHTHISDPQVHNCLLNLNLFEVKSQKCSWVTRFTSVTWPPSHFSNAWHL